jgi:hypothetical protein
MKKKINLLIIFLLFVSISLKAQDCAHFAFNKGASYEMETYDNKDKKTSTNKSLVKDVSVSGSKKETTIHTESFDKKNEKQGEADIKMICEGGKILFDMSHFATNNPMATKDMELKMESSYLEVPEKLTVGQTLPDGNAVIKMMDKKSGELFSTMKITIYNRKVEGKQSITTTAGTFDCYKITYDIKVESSLAMGMNLPAFNSKAIDYNDTNLGLTIKNESLNKKGELMGYTLLTKYSK